MKSLFNFSILILSLILMFTLVSCSKKESSDNTESPTIISPDIEKLPNTSESIQKIEDELGAAFVSVDDFPTEAITSDYTPEAGVTLIKLADSGITIDGAGATCEGSVLTVTNQGTYLLSGKLSCGKIIVNTQDEEKVKLILNGVHIISDSSAVYVLSAPKKVIFNSVAGSVNIFTDGTDYIVPDEAQVEGETYPNACIYSTADLKFSGDGEIYVKSNAGKGINTKDDIEIASGSLTVGAVDDGIRGNDSVEILGGNITVTSGADGVKSANSETAGKGYILVSDGNININAATDALQAETTLTVSGGKFNLLCAGGCDTTAISNVENSASSDARRPGGPGGGMGGMMPPGGMGGMQEGNSQKPDYSCKALKSAGDMLISGGEFTISTPDDAIHSDTALKITGGSLKIAAGDDGIHAEDSLTIDNGEIKILSSYEGIEAVEITVNGGNISVTSRDDGFNACGGTSMMGGPGGWNSSTDTTSSDENPILAFKGGTVTVDASGDGVDSNGNIIMTGGKVIVYGPTNDGNGAIDYGDGSYGMTVSGGIFLAVGASGMAETAQGEGQGVIGVRMGNISADSTVKIADSNGNTMIEFTTPKSMASLVYSSPDIVSGDNYTISVNSQELGTIAAE
ncbi:MAG: carbohydrate-binding domain-containing protein [Ruminococcaceae bacterium]|nr:carbohydrate-binding domain-containing protein [Oscillospiraceae bacterium]